MAEMVQQAQVAIKIYDNDISTHKQFPRRCGFFNPASAAVDTPAECVAALNASVVLRPIGSFLVVCIIQ